ncbi:SUMF1/EgtB/PvdO family nonheme iron enzyme [bacterium]|nr:SUMF1/EgtB/PvdO family nonheme iron enzyme [bacterium]
MLRISILTLFVIGFLSTESYGGSGDVTGDGFVTNADVALLSDYLLGKVQFTPAQLTAANANSDTSIDIADVAKIINNLQATISIDVTPDSGSWTLTGPTGFTAVTGTGDRKGSSKIATRIAGTYTLHCNIVTGYAPPFDLVQDVVLGNATTFNAIYTRLDSNTVMIALPGNVPMLLIKCPAGSFQMGSPDTERSRGSDEGPAHTVNFSQPFFIGKYEVTQEQWRAVMGTNPAQYHGVGNRYPVYYVSWNDIAGAGGFIEKLNAHISKTGQGGPVRLPSEAEWEYACRAGTTTRFFFGDSLSTLDDTHIDGPTDSTAYPGRRSDYMWFACSPGDSKPVGTTPRGGNAWGLFDMSGNIAEWCQDTYHPNYIGAPTDGSPWDTIGNIKIMRGGGWAFGASKCRSANRNNSVFDANARYYVLGFRLARSN